MTAPQPVRTRSMYKTRRRPATCPSNENKSRRPLTWCRIGSVPNPPEYNERGNQPKTRTNLSILPRHSMQKLDRSYDMPALELPPPVALPHCDLQESHYPEPSSPSPSPTGSPTWSPRYKNQRRRHRHTTQIARAAPNSPASVRIETDCTRRQSRLHWRHTSLPEGMESPPWRNSIEDSNGYSSAEEDIDHIPPRTSMSLSKTAKTNSDMSRATWDSDSDSDDDSQPPSTPAGLRLAGFAAIRHLLNESGGDPQSMDTLSLTRLITRKKMQSRSAETYR